VLGLGNPLFLFTYWSSASATAAQARRAPGKVKVSMVIVEERERWVDDAVLFVLILRNGETFLEQLRPWRRLVMCSDELSHSLPRLKLGVATVRRAEFAWQDRVEAQRQRVHVTLGLHETVRVGDSEARLLRIGVARICEVMPALVRTERSVRFPRVPELALNAVSLDCVGLHCGVIDVEHSRAAVAIALLITKIDDDLIAFAATIEPRHAIGTCPVVRENDTV